MKTYRDPSGYSLTYDSSLWNVSTATQSAGSEQQFLMNSEFGNALVSILASPKADADTMKADLVASLPTGEAVTVENPGSRWGLSYTRLVVSDTTLFTPNEYYVYLIEGDASRFRITVKAPSLGQSTEHTERLLDGLVLQPSNVQGAEDRATTPQEVRTAAIAKPSVVNILYLQCNKLSFEATPGAQFRYLDAEYPYCFGGKGTGFFVSDQGYVATNGHVVKSYPEQSLVDGLLQVPELRAFLVDYVSELSFQQTRKDVLPSRVITTVESLVTNPNKLDSLYASFYDSLEKGVMKISEGQANYYVKLTDEPFLFDDERYTSTNSANYVIMTDAVREADLVDIDFADYYSYKATVEQTPPRGSDIAVLKLKGAPQTVPALPLYPGIPKEGQPLIVIGYPALTEGERSTKDGFALVDYYSSSGSQTVTRGVISAFKQDLGGNKLIQTDASIERGNSGGPALVSDGSVVGVATYAFLSQSGNYNFLRDVANLKRLMDRNRVTIGENAAYTAWKTGLEAYWNGDYGTAADNLTKAADIYPMNPLLGEYLEEVKGGISSASPAEATGSAVARVQQVLQTSSPAQLGIYAAMAGITVFFLLLIIVQAVQIQGLRHMVKESLEAAKTPPAPSIPTSTMVP